MPKFKKISFFTLYPNFSKLVHYPFPPLNIPQYLPGGFRTLPRPCPRQGLNLLPLYTEKNYKSIHTYYIFGFLFVIVGLLLSNKSQNGPIFWINLE